MKGEKREYGNKKRICLLAACGVLAISGAVYAGTRPDTRTEPRKDLVDLNEQSEQIGQIELDDPFAMDGQAAEIHEGEQQIAGQEQGELADGKDSSTPETISETGELSAQVPDDSQKPEKDDSGQPAETEPQKPEEEAPKETVDVAGKEPETAPEDKEPAAVVNNPTAQELRFSEEDGLAWPLQGNVIKAYSADKMVYFDTLQQFRTNPAIFIAGEPGAEILASTDGVVEKVEKDDKRGQMITMDIGDGYRLVYGQLGEISVKEGDYVVSGSGIAKLAPVTKYYRIEGDHLYFQVMHESETVDPMTLIQ